MAKDQRDPTDVIVTQGLHPHPGPEVAGGSNDPVVYQIYDPMDTDKDDSEKEDVLDDVLENILLEKLKIKHLRILTLKKTGGDPQQREALKTKMLTANSQGRGSALLATKNVSPIGLPCQPQPQVGGAAAMTN